MKVEIFSTTAAIAGTPYGTTWSGDVELSRSRSAEENLEIVYRLFNRVDEGDHAKMAALGYMLPSLSMGDFVTLHLDAMGPKGPITEPRTWQVASVGFTEVTGNRSMIPLR